MPSVDGSEKKVWIYHWIYSFHMTVRSCLVSLSCYFIVTSCCDRKYSVLKKYVPVFKLLLCWTCCYIFLRSLKSYLKATAITFYMWTIFFFLNHRDAFSVKWPNIIFEKAGLILVCVIFTIYLLEFLQKCITRHLW